MALNFDRAGVSERDPAAALPSKKPPGNRVALKSNAEDGT